MSARAALVALGLLCGSAQAAELDIPWFMAHPAERSQWLRRCQNDNRVANAFPGTCRNADAAETRLHLGRKLRLDRDGFPVPLPDPAPALNPPPRRTIRHGT